MTVGELQRRMSAAEFQEWRLFYMMDPGLHQRISYGAAGIMQQVVNMNLSPKSRPLPLEAFLLDKKIEEARGSREMRTASKQKQVDVNLGLWKAVLEARAKKSAKPGPKKKET